MPIVPRGAGTSLSGGALPREDGILIGMGRMKRILEIDYENRCVMVEPGVTNLNITRAVEAQGFYYAPDPSSQIACTIGGNVAENSGGLHCLKYGLTTNNLLGVKFVLPGGEIVTLGGKARAQGGLDLLGLITGSEGLLGVVVEAMVRILRKAPVTRTLMASFDTVTDAGACVAAVIADGMVPAAMEFMDRRAAEAIETYNAARLSRRRRGHPDHRCRRRGGRSLRRHGADRPHRRACGGQLVRSHRREQRAPKCGRAARPPSPPWAGSRPT